MTEGTSAGPDAGTTEATAPQRSAARRWRLGSPWVDGPVMAAGAAAAFLLLGHEGWPFAAGCAALWWVAVVVIVRSDLELLMIPDQASLAIAGLGLVYATAMPLGAGAALTAVLSSTLGAALNGVAGFALFWFVAWTYRRLARRDGLGFGDVKLAGASAIWLEPADAALALEIAAVAALAVLLARRRTGSVRDVAMPFGAFLAPAAWLAFVSAPMVNAALDRLG